MPARKQPCRLQRLSRQLMSARVHSEGNHSHHQGDSHGHGLLGHNHGSSPHAGHRGHSIQLAVLHPHVDHHHPSLKSLGSSSRRESFRSTNPDINNSPFTALLAENQKWQAEKEEKFAFYESIRIRVKYYMNSTWYGDMYKLALLGGSVLSVFMYILETYFDKESDPRAFIIFSLIELVVAFMFGFDWTLSVYLAEHKLETILGFNAMIDLITVIAVLTSNFVFRKSVPYNHISTGQDVFIYIIYACQTVRILRIMRLHKEFEVIEDKVNRLLAQICLAFITMLLFDSALLQYLEAHEQNLEFHTWAYMMTVTMTTVGYGDITPKSAIGRFAIMGIIYFAIVFVPMQTNKLIEMMSRQSIYARAKYKPRGVAKHVIICGDLESTSLSEFFKELFHEDHENINLHAVVLQPEPPSFEMQEILLDPVFSLMVHYIEGSPLLDGDLARAQAETAVAIFLLSNKFCKDADTEDTKIILQQLSIQRYILASGGKENTSFCMQLLRPENLKHLGPDIEEDDMKLVVCLNQMKMGALAKACLFPGVNTLIFNLLSSFAEDEDPMDEKVSSANARKFDPDATEEDEIGTWLEEYEKGCGWEIYITELADAFEGQKFVDLSYTLYEKIGIVLFALKITDLKGRQQTRVLLNPAEFVIPSKTEYSVQGFVVAENKKQSDLTFSPVEEQSDLSNPFKMFLNKNAALPSGRRDSVNTISSSDTSRRGSSNLPTSPSHRWQDIKAEYDAYREIQVGNAQELLSQQETEHLERNYFVRSRPQSLEDATIATSVLDEIPNVNQHIIIIGKGSSSLYDFIRPWRAKYLGRLKHVVILSAEDISEAIWRRISIFEGILFVKGSALEENDLRRAGIFRASQVVVLADTSGDKKGASSNSTNALEDADTIFSYQLVKRMNEKAHVVVEIVHSSNVGYLDGSASGSLVSAEDYKFTPQFASGILYTSSLLDTVLCQTFYNPQIIRVVDKLISGTDHKPDTLEEISASKKRKSSSKINTKLFDVMGSSLHQIMVPDKMTKQTYGHLFYTLSQMGMIPLGLLRGTFPAMNVGPKGNKLPYVFTNPSKETEVFSCDKVFVLSQKSLNNTKFTTEEIHDNFLKATENAINARRAEREGDLDSKPKSSALSRDLEKFFSSISCEVKNLSSAIGDLKGNTINAVNAFTAAGVSRASKLTPGTRNKRAGISKLKTPLLANIPHHMSSGNMSKATSRSTGVSLSARKSNVSSNSSSTMSKSTSAVPVVVRAFPAPRPKSANNTTTAPAQVGKKLRALSTDTSGTSTDGED